MSAPTTSAADSPAAMSIPIPTTPHRGYVFMVASLLFFVANGLLIRWSAALPGADTWLATGCRYVVGLSVVFIFFLPGGQLELAGLVQKPMLVLRGVLGGIAIYFFYLTIPALGAGRATVINCGYILFAAVMAGPMLGERLTLARGAWLTAGCVGIGVLSSRAGTGVSVSWMDAIALLGAICAAGVVVTIRQLSGTQHYSTIFASQCFYGLVIAAIPAGQSLAVPAGITWMVMIGAGLCAALGQLAMTRAYRDLSIAKGGAVQMLLPILTALGGAALFHERYTLLEILGGALVLFSCFKVLTSPSARKVVTLPEE